MGWDSRLPYDQKPTAYVNREWYCLHTNVPGGTSESRPGPKIGILSQSTVVTVTYRKAVQP